MPSPCIADTNCIHLALTGVPAVLSASPIIENTAQGGINLVCGTGGLADRVASGLTLPGGPKTRDEFYAGPGDAGLIWHLRYTTGRNKWQFLGGGPLHDEIVTTQAVPIYGPVYHDLATVGPQVTVPFDGTYLVQFGAMINLFVPDGAGVDAAMTVEDAGVGIGAYARLYLNVLTNNNDMYETASVATTHVITAVAGDSLIAKYHAERSGGLGTATFFGRWLLVTPLEVS